MNQCTPQPESQTPPPLPGDPLPCLLQSTQIWWHHVDNWGERPSQVLHMDRNNYYGGQSTSFNLNQACAVHGACVLCCSALRVT